MITEKIREVVLKSLEVNGKDMYYIESVLHDKPMVKRIHIRSIEIYPHGNVYLETDHEGRYMTESIGRTLFLTREEADEKLRESYSGDIVNLATLKDCPICHGRAEVREYSHKFAVECSSCGLGTKPDYKLTKAIRLWNERQDE